MTVGVPGYDRLVVMILIMIMIMRVVMMKIDISTKIMPDYDDKWV